MPKKLTIDHMHKLAREREGKYSSENYVNAHTKVEWQCAKKHTWKATPNNIQQGKWCPVCRGGVKSNIDVIRNLASKRGGLCLSDQYNNAYTKLKWQCSEGHPWGAVPANIKNGNAWCPHCAGKLKLNIDRMYELASSRDGKCLSQVYINSRTKWEWQ